MSVETNGNVTVIMSAYDYGRMVTAVKRYAEVLYSAKKYYARQTGRDPEVMGGRSSCTTIFHLLDQPLPEDSILDLTQKTPIPPPAYTPKRPRKKKMVDIPDEKPPMLLSKNPKSILKGCSQPPTIKREVSFSNC